MKNGQSFVRFAYIFLFISGLVVHGGAGRVFLAGARCLRRADGFESAVHGLRFVGHDGFRILPSSFGDAGAFSRAAFGQRHGTGGDGAFDRAGGDTRGDTVPADLRVDAGDGPASDGAARALRISGALRRRLDGAGYGADVFAFVDARICAAGAFGFGGGLRRDGVAFVGGSALVGHGAPCLAAPSHDGEFTVARSRRRAFVAGIRDQRQHQLSALRGIPGHLRTVAADVGRRAFPGGPIGGPAAGISAFGGGPRRRGDDDFPRDDAGGLPAGGAVLRERVFLVVQPAFYPDRIHGSVASDDAA